MTNPLPRIQKGLAIRPLFPGLLLILASYPLTAADQLQLNLGSLGSADWQLQGARLTIDWSANSPALLQVSADMLTIGKQQIENLNLRCQKFELLIEQVRCPAGQLGFRYNQQQAQTLPASFSYNFISQQMNISISQWPLAAAKTRLDFQLANNHWQLSNHFSRLELSSLMQFLNSTGLATGQLNQQGLISGRLNLYGSNKGLNSIDWNLQASTAGYSNATGTQAAEALQLTMKGLATRQATDWQIQASLTATQGMLYTEPVYLEFLASQPLTVSVDMHWQPDANKARIKALHLNQPGVVNTSMSASLNLDTDNPVQQLQMDIHQATLPGFYTSWLQPWLAGSLLDNLATNGRLEGQLTLNGGQPQALQLRLDNVSILQPEGQFDLQQLTADINWDASKNTYTSTLGWQTASFYRLQFGAAELALETSASALKLKAPLTVPLFNGELQVSEFELDLSDDQPGWLLDGQLTPVSMQAVSAALGWPPLSGTLSGMIPRASYQNHELTLGGVFLVQAFDGDITLHNLRVLNPLGKVPRLWADVRLKHLDLKTLTRTFSFGRIEGRLEGRVNDLYMEVWQPVSFDAVFATPINDNSRHRISQRAVDNISNLGGAGIAGTLSRSFLRFLKDFPYKALGVRCRLENGICFMGGVGPARSGQGYYLVEGRWLPPRLDVIGFSNAVDWYSLLDRLKRVTEGEAPLIE